MSVLLLAGTEEARKIAQGLRAREASVIASFAGRTRSPKGLNTQTHTGGFGGGDGFIRFVDEQKITTVIDATHPYAEKITQRTAALCQRLKIPYAHLLRPKWLPQKGDDWTQIDRPEDAAQYVQTWQTVLLTTGRSTIHAFSSLAGRRVVCRVIDPPTRVFPFEGGEFLISRPPFSLGKEITLLRALKADWIIAKNSGSQSGHSKILAARQLCIPILMLKRPYTGGSSCFETVDEVLSWFEQQKENPHG